MSLLSGYILSSDDYELIQKTLCKQYGKPESYGFQMSTEVNERIAFVILVSATRWVRGRCS